MKKVIAVLIAFLIIVSSFALNVGETASGFMNPDLAGKYFLSKKILGQSWVILDFFATGCKGCKKELPEQESLYKDFSGKGLQIFVFATDKEGSRVVRKYFAENPGPLTVLIDRYLVTAKKYGVEGIPSVFLIAPDMKVMVKGTGYSKKIIEDMQKVLTVAMQ
ncbi:MAG: TlpA family protein disulfide reductase [Spirochaetes bacterium]|nr:TlpA family protein disulfide reductase [Spirochaetota bacterium]